MRRLATMSFDETAHWMSGHDALAALRDAGCERSTVWLYFACKDEHLTSRYVFRSRVVRRDEITRLIGLFKQHGTHFRWTMFRKENPS